MSNAIFNRVGQDSTECELVQFGSNTAECRLQHDLLDGSLSYHFGVTGLSVPLNKIPINPVTVDTPILQLKRRNHGAEFSVANFPFVGIYNEFVKVATTSTQAEMFAFHTTHGGPLALGPFTAASPREAMYQAYADYFNELTSEPIFGRQPAIALGNGQMVGRLTQQDQTFVISPNVPHYTVSQFFSALVDWSKKLNQRIHLDGLHEDENNVEYSIDPVNDFDANPVVNYLEFTITADTSIEIEGTAEFWDAFAIELSTYGIALLGIDKKQLFEHGGRYFITRSNDNFKETFLDANDATQMAAGGYNFHPGTFSSGTPLFQSADQRVSCSVSCHLPMDSHLVIRDGAQTTSREICKSFFESDIRTTLLFADNVYESTEIACRTYADQVHMIKRTDGNIQWNRLKESYDIKLLRFYLHITYKLFQNDKFKMVTEDFPVDDNNYWQVTVQFISDY